MDADGADTAIQCYKRSCIQLNCTTVDINRREPNFCPLLASTWVGSPSPFFHLIPADPFCGPGAYLQCSVSLPQEEIHIYFQVPNDYVVDLIRLVELRATWWCKTHPLWAIISAPIWIPMIILILFLIVFATMAIIISGIALIPLYFLFQIFVFIAGVLHSAGLELVEDMPFIATAVIFIVSFLATARCIRARFRKSTSPRAE